MVWRVKDAGAPSRVRPLRLAPPPGVGTSPRRPSAPAATLTLNVSSLLLQARLLNDDPLRPSSQVSICFDVTIGTPRALAEATMASLPAEVGLSVCMFAVNTP